MKLLRGGYSGLCCNECPQKKAPRLAPLDRPAPHVHHVHCVFFAWHEQALCKRSPLLLPAQLRRLVASCPLDPRGAVAHPPPLMPDTTAAPPAAGPGRRSCRGGQAAAISPGLRSLTSITPPPLQHRRQMRGRVPSLFPIKDFVDLVHDPYLPWLHDLFVSKDGTRVDVLSQNRHSCQKGKYHRDEMRQRRLDKQSQLGWCGSWEGGRRCLVPIELAQGGGR